MYLARGRLLKNTNKLVKKFINSISIDVRLYKYDILGSIAHIKMLSKCKIIFLEEAKKIIKALKEIEKEIEDNKFKFKLEDEDIHLNIERRLIEKIGEIGKKIHTSRSRNDQIVLDMRMFLKHEIKEICSLIKIFQKTLVEVAEKNIKVIIPGYTHLQHAQPVLLAHHFLAYFFACNRDYERLKEIYQRVNVMPLGAVALAGSSFNIDRQYVAKLLDFPRISQNSIDTVSDRDFIIEFLSAISILIMHFSRLSEELILWSTQEFNFIELDDAFCTSSSIMSQKKNPDVVELIRATTGIIYGNLVSLLTIMKSLPLSYNRDMQLDKRALFDTVDNIKMILTLMPNLIASLKIKSENIKFHLERSFITASDITDYLTKKNIPFREAYRITAEIIKYCLQIKKVFKELTLEEFKIFSSKFEKDIIETIKIENSIKAKKSFGGTSLEQVKRTIRKLKQGLSSKSNYTF